MKPTPRRLLASLLLCVSLAGCSGQAGHVGSTLVQSMVYQPIRTQSHKGEVILYIVVIGGLLVGGVTAALANDP